MIKNITIGSCFEGFLQIVLLIFLYLSMNSSVLAFELEAELDWARQVKLGTPVRGVIEQVMVSPGQRVKQGEALLQLDQRGFEYRVAGLTAQLQHFKAELDEARREQERALELYDRTVLSDHELQVAKNKFIAAKSNYQKGKADLAQARLDLEYTVVRAPFDAVIIMRQAEAGQIVVPDLKPIVLLVVVDAKHMYANAKITPKQLPRVALEKEAMVKVKDATYKGRVVSLTQLSAPQDQVDNRNFLLKVEFPVENQKLYSGQTAKIIFQ